MSLGRIAMLTIIKNNCCNFFFVCVATFKCFSLQVLYYIPPSYIDVEVKEFYVLNDY